VHKTVTCIGWRYQRLHIYNYYVDLLKISRVVLETCRGILINVLYVNKQEFCASRWRSSRVILRCTVNQSSRCRAVFERRAINLREWCIWLVDLFESLNLRQQIKLFLSSIRILCLRWNTTIQVRNLCYLLVFISQLVYSIFYMSAAVLLTTRTNEKNCEIYSSRFTSVVVIAISSTE